MPPQTTVMIQNLIEDLAIKKKTIISMFGCQKLSSIRASLFTVILNFQNQKLTFLLRINMPSKFHNFLEFFSRNINYINQQWFKSFKLLILICLCMHVKSLICSTIMCKFVYNNLYKVLQISSNQIHYSNLI
jgi:hypothetical protein